MKSKLPQRLFKYTSIDKYSLENLNECQLYFNAPIAFNDPFDCSLLLETVVFNDAEIVKFYNYWIMKNNINHLNVVKDASTIPEELYQKIITQLKKHIRNKQEQYISSIGCTCFSEGKDNILLWSHYGDKHTGMCLEFDTTWNLFLKAFIVNYSTDFPRWDIVKMILDPTPRDGSKDIFLPMLTKSKVWEYEQEWRIFHKFAKTFENYNPMYLKSIYFGIMTDQKDIDKIRNIASVKYKQIKLYKAKKSVSKYEIEFNPLPSD